MTPERWRRIREVLEPALEQPAGERARWLDRHCDPELRDEVEALLEASLPEQSFLDAPVWTPTGLVPPGTRIAHYVIDEPLGMGGMGVVYRARDTRLNRPVAIKVLTWGAGDLDLLAEARTASSLNHPNIVVVYDVLEFRGAPVMVMELVRGQTLTDLLRDGPLPERQAVRFATQIASALATAHDAGVLHRDLKPANVMVRPDNVVKVLDFGIARSAGSSDDAGRRGGTAAYMPPEQAVGTPPDERADVFGFGGVLRDMLTGRGPKPSSIPPRWRSLVRRCLALALEKRPVSMRAIESELRRPASSAFGWRGAVAAAAAVALFAIVGTLLWGTPTPVEPAYSSRRLASSDAARLFPRISPDGQRVAYAIRDGDSSRLVVHERGQVVPRDLGLDGRHPAWAPDGRHIAFRSQRDGGGLFLLDVESGDARRLTDVGFHPAWSPDGNRLVFSTAEFSRVEERPTTDSELWTVEVDSGQTARVVGRDQIVDAIQPAWSPDGRRIAFWSVDNGGRRAVWTVAAAGGTPAPVTDGRSLAWSPAWSRDGWLYWSSNRTGAMNVWRTRVNPTTGAVVGEPDSVTLPASYVAFMSFADDGTMAYGTQQPLVSIWRARLEQAASPPVRVTPRTLQVVAPSLSPDGDWIVGYVQDRIENLVLFRPDGSDFRSLTTGDHRDRGPAWSPDGQTIAFGSNRGGDYQLWQIRPDGTGLAPLLTHPEGAFSPVWAPDSARLAWFTRGFRPFISDGDEVQALPMPEGGGFRPDDWSKDGSLIVGQLRTDTGGRLGHLLYRVADRRYAAVNVRCNWVRFAHGSNDLICADGRTLLLVSSDGDTAVLAELPSAIENQFLVSPDGRWVYLQIAENLTEVWLADPR